MLAPGSEDDGVGAPRDYLRDHPGERPAQWGWHAKWGRGGRGAGLVVAAILLLMTTTTNYQVSYTITLIASAAILVALVFCRRFGRRR